VSTVRYSAAALRTLFEVALEYAFIAAICDEDQST